MKWSQHDVLAVKFHTINHDFCFVGLEEAPGVLRVFGKVDDQEIRDEADDGGDDAFNDKISAPARSASNSIHSRDLERVS